MKGASASAISFISILASVLLTTATEPSPSSCCYNLLLNFESIDAVTPVDAAVPWNPEIQGIKMNGVGIGNKIAGVNVGPDPMGEYYLYYGMTTSVGSGGNPFMTVKYGSSNLRKFIISDFFGGAGFAIPANFIIPVKNIQLLCNNTLTAYSEDGTIAGSQTFTYTSASGTAQYLVQSKVNPKAFSTLSWRSVEFTSDYYVKISGALLGTGDQFVKLSDFLNDLITKLGVKDKIKPSTYMDDFHMIASPLSCAACQ